jgi:hypothetical protein
MRAFLLSAVIRAGVIKIVTQIVTRPLSMGWD